MSTRRLLLIASAGGHWVQLSRLSLAFEAYDVLYATTMRDVKAPSGNRPVSLVRDFSRSNPFMLMLGFMQIFALLLKFRPDVVISTGAAPGLIALRIGKLLGARTVWIDSIANSEELSYSGQLAKSCADLWLTQWPHLVEKYPNLQCFGSVL
jgi:UDP-N-acetylglucosamine:LPS N-acetylglucosamine transferase